MSASKRENSSTRGSLFESQVEWPACPNCGKRTDTVLSYPMDQVRFLAIFYCCNRDMELDKHPLLA